MEASEWLRLIAYEKAFIVLNPNSFEPHIRYNGKKYEMPEEVSDYLFMKTHWMY